MKHITFVLVFLFYLCSYCGKKEKRNLSVSRKKSDAPNIIFIFADDLGYGDIGPYGQKKIATPYLDKMAKEGMLFTDFYSGSTVCAPARASLMTGLTTGRAPIRGNREIYPEGQFPLPQAAVTVAAVLKRSGYKTAAFGKWGMGTVGSCGSPNVKGFDEFFGYICQRQAHDYYPEYLWHNRTKVDLSVNKIRDSVYSAALIHEKAMDFIDRRQKGQPFFLYLPYTLPHADVIAPHDSVYWDYVRQFAEEPLRREKSAQPLREPYPHAAFAAMVTRLDRYVGEIIGKIAEKGMADHTLIIFTSDNGPHREGGGDPEFFKSGGIFRGIKRDLYEGGIREPFIAYMPSGIKPSVESNCFALWDMFPTFLDFAGIDDTEYDLDGVSIKPVLLGQGQQKHHEFLYWEFHEGGGKQAVRFNNWKGVRLAVNTGAKPLELYNLDEDPSERRDLSVQHPEIAARLEVLIRQVHTFNPEFPLLKEELQK